MKWFIVCVLTGRVQIRRQLRSRYYTINQRHISRPTMFVFALFEDNDETQTQAIPFYLSNGT